MCCHACAVMCGPCKAVYLAKITTIGDDAEKISNGLIKLAEAEEGVSVMQVELAETEKVLLKTSQRIEKMLVGLRENKAKAEKVKSAVLKKKNALADQQQEITICKDDANKDLEEALPALAAAESALDAIKPDDIKALKALKNPPNIIKRIFDGVLILQREGLNTVMVDSKTKTKGGAAIIETSYVAHVLRMLCQPTCM